MAARQNGIKLGADSAGIASQILACAVTSAATFMGTFRCTNFLTVRILVTILGVISAARRRDADDRLGHGGDQKNRFI
jgi:hypothetical protein